MRNLVAGIMALPLMVGGAVAESWNSEDPINGVSRETFFRSMQTAIQRMTDEEKVTFRRGVNTLILRDFPLTYGMPTKQAAPFLPLALEAAHVTLDGVPLGHIMKIGRQMGQETNQLTAPQMEPVKLQKAQSSLQMQNPIARSKGPSKAQTEREAMTATYFNKVRACLTKKIPFAVRYLRTGSIYDALEIEMTNGLSWPIGSVDVGYAITTSGRTLPYSAKEMSRTLRGGVLPGESRKVRITVSAIPKEILEDHLDIQFAILNVGDMKGKSLLNQPKALFTGGLTDYTCE